MSKNEREDMRVWLGHLGIGSSSFEQYYNKFMASVLSKFLCVGSQLGEGVDLLATTKERLIFGF